MTPDVVLDWQWAKVYGILHADLKEYLYERTLDRDNEQQEMMTIAGEIEKALTDCVNDIRRRSTQAGQVATGRTLRALEVRVRNEGAAIIGEIWGRPFTGALETGSRPARRKGTAAERKAMVADMKEWCRIRGLTDGHDRRAGRELPRTLAVLVHQALRLGTVPQRRQTRHHNPGC